MGKFEIRVKGRLENVRMIEFPQDFRWFFTISCGNCREMYPKEVYLVAGEVMEAFGSRGSFNFVSKCRFCDSLGTLSFDGRLGGYEDSEEEKRVGCLEARGVKVHEWVLNSGFGVISESGKVFEDVRLDEGDWVEYDDSGEYLIGVYEVATSVCQC